MPKVSGNRLLPLQCLALVILLQFFYDPGDKAAVPQTPSNLLIPCNAADGLGFGILPCRRRVSISRDIKLDESLEFDAVGTVMED